MKSEAYLTKRLVNLFLLTCELGTFCHKPLIVLSSFAWKISGAGEIPNGSSVHRYLPVGETNVVSSLDVLSSPTSQNPFFMSQTEKILAVDNRVKTSSMVGSG